MLVARDGKASAGSAEILEPRLLIRYQSGQVASRQISWDILRSIFQGSPSGRLMVSSLYIPSGGG